MKRIKYLLFTLLLTLICGNVYAIQFAVQCEVADLKVGDTVKCHLVANNYNDNVYDLIETRVTDLKKLSIESIGSLWTAEADGGVIPVTTEVDSNFELNGVSNFGLIHKNGVKCTDTPYDCYDFFSKNGFLNKIDQFGNANMPRSATGFTSLGYFVVKLTDDASVSDCGRLCLDVSTHERGSDNQGTSATTTPVCAEVVGRNPLICACEDDNNDEVVCYGIDGEIVPGAKTVDEACPPPLYCEIKDGKYYDDEGKEVEKEEFKKVCGCRIEDDKYYDDEGKEVEKDEFKKVCGCRKEDDKYYDDEGKEVEEDEYKKICGCRKDGDDYYDDKGEKVEEEEWKRRCEPYCYYDKEQDKYFLKPGEEITKEFYDNQCTPTGSFASYAILLAGIFIAISAITIAQKHNKFYRV